MRNAYAPFLTTRAFALLTASRLMVLKSPYPGVPITPVAFFGLLFGICMRRYSGRSVALVFALTVWMGHTLGPIIAI